MIYCRFHAKLHELQVGYGVSQYRYSMRKSDPQVTHVQP